MLRHLPLLIVSLYILWVSGDGNAQEPPRLENGKIGLSFDQKTGALVAIENKLAGETYQVRGDEFGVEAVEFRTTFDGLKLVSLDRQGEVVKARYEGGGMTAETTYTLHGENHFAEKQLTLTCNRKCGLKKVVVSRPTFSGPSLQVVPYRYSQFERSPGESRSAPSLVERPKEVSSQDWSAATMPRRQRATTWSWSSRRA